MSNTGQYLVNEGVSHVASNPYQWCVQCGVNVCILDVL